MQKSTFQDPQESRCHVVNQIFMAEELFHLRSFEVLWGTFYLKYNKFSWLRRLYERMD